MISKLKEKLIAAYETMQFQSSVETNWNLYKEKIPVSGVIAEAYIDGKVSNIFIIIFIIFLILFIIFFFLFSLILLIFLFFC